MAEERTRRRPRPGLGGQLFGLILGVVPLLLVMAMLTRGGAGLHHVVLGLWFVAIAGFLTSLAYHLTYRRSVPKSVISSPSIWKTLPVATGLFLFGLLNLWGTPGGWALQLTPNTMEQPQRWLQLAAKLALHEPVVGTSSVAAFQPWVLAPNFFGGALWGALGYATAFAIGGGLASALRKEAFDPRQEPFGTASFWPLLRTLIGYYYGWGLGFGFGFAIIWALVATAGGSASPPATILALRYALGALPDPNHAFTMGLVSGSWLLAGAMVFLGRGDVTVAFTDPKPAEKEPPMKVTIPPLPKNEMPELDFGALVAETEQLASTFGRDLQTLVQKMGLTDAPPPAFTPPPTAATEDEEPEVEAVNLLSARKPDFDLSFDQALGQLSSVYVQISARLGQLEISLADWLTLEEGSLLEMPRNPDGSVALCINGRPVGRSKPAAFENHVAVKVVKLESGTVEALKGGAS